MDASGLATANLRAAVDCAPTKPSAVRWWREKEFWFVLLIVAGIYFGRPTALSIRGEESRWANVAREMLETGDFVVPREQGQVFANRPPLNNWILAAIMAATGRQDAWVVRFPSLCATLATALVIYICGRSFLSRFGALIGALAFAGMGQVLQLGRQAESEPMLTLLVAASLLGWLRCYLRGSSPYAMWLVGYGFAALAALSKGPQGPAYFIGATWTFLFCFDRPLLLHRAHLAGLALFAAILAIWQVPLMLAVGLGDAVSIWTYEVTRRVGQSQSIGRRLTHVFAFPWEVLGCMLPWSGLLLGYGNPTLRRKLEKCLRPAQFLAIASIVGLLPLLLTTQARGRYFMPLYPCTALLAAIVVETSLASATARRAALVWRGFLAGCAIAAPAGAIFVLSASIVPYWSEGPYAQPLVVACGFAACAGATAWCCRTALLRLEKRTSQFAALAIAAFCGVTCTVVIVNAQRARSSDPRGAVVELCRQLPGDAQLVSFETVHHLFAYHAAEAAGRSVRLVAEPASDRDRIGEWDYFCLNSFSENKRPLPFAWEPVGIVPVDRNRYAPPRDYVVVGRRLPAGASPSHPSSTVPSSDSQRLPAAVLEAARAAATKR